MLRAHYEQTTNVEKKIIDFILENTQTFIRLPITDIAEKIGSNPSSISRLCSKMQVKNISEFKIRMAQEIVSDEKKTGQTKKEYKLPVDLTQSKAEIVETIIHFEIEHFELFKNTLDIKPLIEASALLHKAQQVYIFGIGASAVVGLDVSHKLSRLEKKCFWSMDEDVQRMAACSMEQKDLAFCISYSGKSTSVCQSAAIAKEKNAKVIALCARSGSPLTTHADVQIMTPFTDPKKHIGADVSRIHHLLIVDILCALFVAKNLPLSLQALENTRAVVKGKK